MNVEAPDQPEPVGYPSKDDVEWVAVDRHGRMGIFTTGGEGPIPRTYLRNPSTFERIHAVLYALPDCSEAVLLAQVPRPDDFLAFAHRGCFAFDWADVHREARRSGLYELQARPVMPLDFAAADWPDDLRPLLEQARSDQLDFSQHTLDVSVLGCDQGS